MQNGGMGDADGLRETFGICEVPQRKVRRHHSQVQDKEKLQAQLRYHSKGSVIQVIQPSKLVDWSDVRYNAGFQPRFTKTAGLERHQDTLPK